MVGENGRVNKDLFVGGQQDLRTLFCMYLVWRRDREKCRFPGINEYTQEAAINHTVSEYFFNLSLRNRFMETMFSIAQIRQRSVSIDKQ